MANFFYSCCTSRRWLIISDSDSINIQYVSKISCTFSKQNYNKIATKSKQNSNKIKTKTKQKHNKTATKSKFWSNKIMILLRFCFDFVAFLFWFCCCFVLILLLFCFDFVAILFWKTYNLFLTRTVYVCVKSRDSLISYYVKLTNIQLY